MQQSEHPPGLDAHIAELANTPVVTAHPYEPVDPFSASISLRIRNNRRRNTITSIDDIGPPSRQQAPSQARVPRSRPSSWAATRSSRGTSPSSASKSPMESKKSLPLTPLPSLPKSDDPEKDLVSSSSSPANSVVRQPGFFPRPRRRDAVDETMIDVSSRLAAAGTAESRGEVSSGSGSQELRTSSREETNGRTRDEWRGLGQRQSSPPHSRSPSIAPVSLRYGVHMQQGNLSEIMGPTHLTSSQMPQSPNVYMNSPITGPNVEASLKEYIRTFLLVTLPGQIYLHCLLRLPYMYFSRVDQIFVDANMTLEEIKEFALQDGAGSNSRRSPTEAPKSYLRLKQSWEQFIDNLMREWKTLNIISGLLLSGILTIFQVEGANGDPWTRYAALLSLNCALLSLMYGCIFIIRFSGMRRVYRAAEWAIEAQHEHNIIWNVFVMLALPAIWLVWSILAYVAAIMAFMWRVRPGYIPPKDPSNEDFILRVFVCIVFGIGLGYAVLTINSLRHYGSEMDKAWKRRIESFRQSRSDTKPSEDRGYQTACESGMRSRSIFVELVPPTPTRSAYTFPSPRPSPSDKSIPPSLSRRDEDFESRTSSMEESSESSHVHPLIFSSIHTSPEAMLPLEIPLAIVDDHPLPEPVTGYLGRSEPEPDDWGMGIPRPSSREDINKRDHTHPLILGDPVVPSRPTDEVSQPPILSPIQESVEPLSATADTRARQVSQIKSSGGTRSEQSPHRAPGSRPSSIVGLSERRSKRNLTPVPELLEMACSKPAVSQNDDEKVPVAIREPEEPQQHLRSREQNDNSDSLVLMRDASRDLNHTPD